MIASNFNNVQPGLRGDWTEVEGNWILRPLQGAATAVVHFLGGAFVGAAPQLTYRLLLESLAARGVMVSTPFVILCLQWLLCLSCARTMCLTHCRCCVALPFTAVGGKSLSTSILAVTDAPASIL